MPGPLLCTRERGASAFTTPHELIITSVPPPRPRRPTPPPLARICRPPGDAISRKGVVDSLLLGCIPVFFHSDQARQWPWHFAPWAARASITLDADGPFASDVIGHLARVPAQQVRAMQLEIAQNAWRLVYRRSDEEAQGGQGGTDAFGIILQRLAMRRNARDAPLRDCRPPTNRTFAQEHREHMNPLALPDPSATPAQKSRA